MNLRLAGIIDESVVDGSGIRTVLFAQGCPHRCFMCHNEHTHSFEGGTEYSAESIAKRAHENPILSGVTFSGGEPFSQAEAFAQLAKILDKRLNIWCYSGYTFEEILASKSKPFLQLLDCVDVLCDGKFIYEKRNAALPFRGSENQRLIDVKKSLSLGSVVLLEPK